MDQGKESKFKQKRFGHAGYKTNRISKSYTDISSQISGNSSGRKFSEKSSNYRSDVKAILPTKKIDYDFLRELLGVGAKMGERKRTRGERFLSEELKEAVLKLRGEVHSLKLEIKDKNWLTTLDDLGDIRDMNSDLLEALYMLRNAYKRGIFSSTQCVKDEDVDADRGLPSAMKDKQINSSLLVTPELTINSLSRHNRCSSPMSTASHVSSDWSSDVESTTSSIIVKRRPATPRIHLSSASLSELLNREDDVLVLQSSDFVFTSEKNPPVAIDPGSVADNEATGRPGSADSSTSYLNLGLGDDPLASKHNDDKTDCAADYAYFNSTNAKAGQTDNRMYDEFRSNSPTSCLLRPLFQYAMSSEIYEAVQDIRSHLSPQLARLKNLEDDVKLMPVLQVKLAVLQEEKRQLMNIIKQKRGLRQSVSSHQSSNNSSPVHSRGSSPTSFMSDADDAILIRPSPRRALATKETQTDDAEPMFKWLMCPYCLQKTMHHKDGIHVEGDATKTEFREIETSMVREETIETPEAEVVLNSVPLEDIFAEKSKFVEVGIQSHVDQFDVETSTIEKTFEHAASGDCCVRPDVKSACTGTISKCFSDKAVEVSPPIRLFADACVQKEADVVHNSSQVDKTSYADKSMMVGCTRNDMNSLGLQSSPCTKDASFGDDVAIRVHRDNETQDCVQLIDREAQCTRLAAVDAAVTCGCGVFELKTIGCQAHVQQSDFQCGDGLADIAKRSIASQKNAETRDTCTSPIERPLRDISTNCNFNQKDSVTIGVGESRVTDLLCDLCANKELVSTCVGSYYVGDLAATDNERSTEYLCRIDDKLCDCEKPQTMDMAIGDSAIDEVVCDICKNKTSNSVACGDDRTDILPCDKCDNTKLATTGCGDDDVNVSSCERCVCRGMMVNKEIGEGNVFDVFCENCRALSQKQSADQGSNDDNYIHLDDTDKRLVENGEEPEICSEVYQIMMNSNLNSDANNHPVICNYCGNKVDINDPYLDDELAKMRENFSAYKTNRLAMTKGVDNLAHFDQTEEEIDGKSDDGESEDEESDIEGYDDSTSNDIVESCKMLQHHFSGEKPLKQQLMLKYLANIESLWFQTVKKKRANAAVVKSNIDLFQSRIPELVGTIINLMDEDGNGALHFALTYKNTGVVSILLDSNECEVDLVNKAGYSPVMLAALAGFDSKTDKYVMQRLLRAGDVNCKNKESGQTPLMLAVSRGNVGMVELLLDAGADVNETDNDGSTALMCACENGSMAIVKALLSSPDCDSTIEDHEGSTALTIAMDAKRRDLALLIYGSLNFDMRGRIKLTPSKQSLLGLGVRRSPSPVIGKM